MDHLTLQVFRLTIRLQKRPAGPEAELSTAAVSLPLLGVLRIGRQITGLSIARRSQTPTAPSHETVSGTGLTVRDVAGELVASEVEYMEIGEAVKFRRSGSGELIVGQIHDPQLGERAQP